MGQQHTEVGSEVLSAGVASEPLEQAPRQAYALPKMVSKAECRACWNAIWLAGWELKRCSFTSKCLNWLGAPGKLMRPEELMR